MEKRHFRSQNFTYKLSNNSNPCIWNLRQWFYWKKWPSEPILSNATSKWTKYNYAYNTVINSSENIIVPCVHWSINQSINQLITDIETKKYSYFKLEVFHDYLTYSVIHFSHACFAISPIQSKKYVGLRSCRHLEASMDVNQVFELIFIEVVNEWLNGPLATTHQSHSPLRSYTQTIPIHSIT